jgi:hypothetical protein
MVPHPDAIYRASRPVFANKNRLVVNQNHIENFEVAKRLGPRTGAGSTGLSGEPQMTGNGKNGPKMPVAVIGFICLYISYLVGSI